MNPGQIRPRWFPTLASVACLAILSSSPATAQGKKKDDWYGQWRYEFDLGAFAADVETRIRLDSTQTPGTEFSLENDLGLKDNDTSALFRFAYRFGRRSSISFTDFNLKRNGHSESRIDITLPNPNDPDETIEIGTDVVADSKFNADTLVLAYGYSFINNPKAEFALRFGIHVTDLSLGLQTPNQPEIPDTAEAVTAPLPTFGILGGYRFADNWYVNADLGYFALEIDNYDGSIISGIVGVTWQPFKYVGFSLNYQTFEVEIDVESDDFGGVSSSLLWKYSGPALNVVVRF
jgi:hypothetical protein